MIRAIGGAKCTLCGRTDFHVHRPQNASSPARRKITGGAGQVGARSLAPQGKPSRGDK